MSTPDNRSDAPPPRPEDTIDFGPVFRLAKEWITATVHGVLNLIGFLLRNTRWLILGALLGTAAGYGFYKIVPPVFRTSLTLTSNTLSNLVCYRQVNELEHMILDNSPDLLAATLHITEADAELIHDLEYINLDQDVDVSDTLVLSQFFRIQAEVYDNRILPTLESALVEYLENNPYARVRKELEEDRLTKMIAKLQAEINSLDSLKAVVKKSLVPRASNVGFIYGEAPDPIAIYKESVSLYERQLELSAELRLLQNVQVVDHFTAFEKPHFPRPWISLFIGAFAGGLMALTLLIVRHFRRKPVVEHQHNG